LFQLEALEEERMHAWLRVRWLVVLGMLLSVLAGCGGSDSPAVAGPGLVGIDNRPTVAVTAPELSIQYTLPGVPGDFRMALLSDQPTDGDIAYDPVRGSFTITQGADTLLFGIDLAHPNQPEYRAFLDFPLDGSTKGPVLPLDAVILSATLTLFVNFVDFAATVPILLDLVEYSVFLGLTPADFSSVPLAVRSFSIHRLDANRDLHIDVTPLMTTAQALALNDFQVRLLLGP
jgi:hypothetical protein